MTEALAADGSDMSELNTAMTQFVCELKMFRDDVQTKLKAQEDRMTMLDRKTALKARTPLSNTAEVEVPHQKAFNAYLRSGDDDGLRGLVIEEKGLTVASDGGYLAAPQLADTVQNALRGSASLRKLANVVAVESAAYEVLVDRGDMGAGWATEAAAQTETTAPKVERVSIPLHELSAMPKASQRLLDDAAFDVENWLAERVVQRFARAEAAAFLTGDGQDKPKGLLTYPTAAAGKETEAQIGVVDAGGPITEAARVADALIDTVYALGAEYRANAAFVMNSRTAAAIRKIKDVDGRFIWTDSLAAGEPSQLLGYPVLVCEDMPEAGAGKFPVAFGDFHQAYTIAERPDLRVLRDPFSAKPHVLFYATKRVGGGVTDMRAVKLLKFA